MHPRFAGLAPTLAILLLVTAATRAQVVADFTSDVVSGSNPLTVSFTNLSTGGPIVYLWDFGDGTSATAANPVHTFPYGGPYTVELIALANAFDNDTETKADYISVSSVPFAASFGVSVHNGVDELTVDFSDTSVPEPTSWLWDFGDNRTSTEQHPTHVFDAALSTYDVSLTATYWGQSDEDLQADVISMAPAPIGSPSKIDDFTTLSIAAGDLDGDGDLDVMRKRDTIAQQIEWYANDGSGDFSLAQTLPVSDYYAPFALGDLDGDGDLDMIHESTSAGAVWFANSDGLGTFVEQPATAILGLSPFALGDMDGDGDLDVVNGETLAELTWYENTDGAGNFPDGMPLGLFSPATVSGLQLADVDGDGDLDAGWSTNAGAGWSENLLGDATAWVTHVIVAQPLDGLDLADIDGDGDLDALVTGTGVGPVPIGWLENIDGAGTFASIQALPDATSKENLARAADFDRDGDLDVVSWGDSGPMQWRKNLDGAGTFGAPETIATTYSERILPCDLDGDGDDDLLVGRFGSVLWYENHHSASFHDAGPGLAGSAGTPDLDAFGSLGPDDAFTLALHEAAPGGTGLLVLGASAVNAPFKGGTLVPFPDAVVPLPLDVNGVLVLHLTWPPGSPAGLPIFVQYWIPDAGAILGYAASNAVEGTTDP